MLLEMGRLDQTNLFRQVREHQPSVGEAPPPRLGERRQHGLDVILRAPRVVQDQVRVEQGGLVAVCGPCRQGRERLSEVARMRRNNNR